jgi:hypothetical protein
MWDLHDIEDLNPASPGRPRSYNIYEFSQFLLRRSFAGQQVASTIPALHASGVSFRALTPSLSNMGGIDVDPGGLNASDFIN